MEVCEIKYKWSKLTGDQKKTLMKKHSWGVNAHKDAKILHTGP